LLPSDRLQREVGPLRLLGLDLTKAGEDQHKRTLRKGNTAQLTLYWQSHGAAPPDCTPDVLLVDNRGNAVASIISPVMSRYPPSEWQEGELIRDPRRWLVEAPPGTYRLQARWSLSDPMVDLGSIKIEAAP
jgi:hypothetical protein